MYCPLIVIYCYYKGDDGFTFRLFFYPGYKRRIHSFRLFTLACLLTGVLVDNTVLNPFFRMLILGSHLRNFQKELWTLLKMVSYHPIIVSAITNEEPY
ncbi:MAG: hypothetical protein ACI8RD_008183 [Bacillariaceae sp.]|jgi:hypothetical protein